MKARIECPPARFEARIWLYEETPHGVYVHRPVHHPDEATGWQVETVEPGITPEPSLELPIEALEAIVRAGGDHLPPSSAQAEHLADTREVRDRLLSLVEQAQDLGFGPDPEPLVQNKRRS